MEKIGNVKYINMHLPPIATWEDRTQEIEILGSIDGNNFNTVVQKTAYTFSVKDGNMIAIILDQSVQMRYIKIVFYSNDSKYGGQISELYVYEE